MDSAFCHGTNVLEEELDDKKHICFSNDKCKRRKLRKKRETCNNNREGGHFRWSGWGRPQKFSL